MYTVVEEEVTFYCILFNRKKIGVILSKVLLHLPTRNISPVFLNRDRNIVRSAGPPAGTLWANPGLLFRHHLGYAFNP